MGWFNNSPFWGLVPIFFSRWFSQKSPTNLAPKRSCRTKKRRFRGHPQIGGIPRWWFQIFLEFSPRNLGKITIFDEHIFQMVLVQPPTSYPMIILIPSSKSQYECVDPPSDFFLVPKGKNSITMKDRSRIDRSGFSPRWCLKSFVWDLWVTRWVGDFLFL